MKTGRLLVWVFIGITAITLGSYCWALVEIPKEKKAWIPEGFQGVKPPVRSNGQLLEKKRPKDPATEVKFIKERNHVEDSAHSQDAIQAEQPEVESDQTLAKAPIENASKKLVVGDSNGNDDLDVGEKWEIASSNDRWRAIYEDSGEYKIDVKWRRDKHLSAYDYADLVDGQTVTIDGHTTTLKTHAQPIPTFDPQSPKEGISIKIKGDGGRIDELDLGEKFGIVSPNEEWIAIYTTGTEIKIDVRGGRDKDLTYGDLGHLVKGETIPVGDGNGNGKVDAEERWQIKSSNGKWRAIYEDGGEYKIDVKWGKDEKLSWDDLNKLMKGETIKIDGHTVVLATVKLDYEER